jgi:hypothetical protein
MTNPSRTVNRKVMVMRSSTFATVWAARKMVTLATIITSAMMVAGMVGGLRSVVAVFNFSSPLFFG